HLVLNGELPDKYKPNILSGDYNGFWKCHIKSDWLLIWELDKENKIIKLVRTGSQSDLF
ncbi:MAG: type II toxin-antitoxin system YafQ family toxin, partial [Bacteroidales bacterium]|nr:type II toxin-antitoxin system YafQ family toxin [Bacteroidales bacterium]